MGYTELIIYGTILGVTLAFMIGPVFFVLIETSLTKGPSRAIVFDIGVILADILFINITYFSSSLIDIAEDSLWIYWIGGLLVIGYGIYNIINAKRKKIVAGKRIELPTNHAPYYIYFIKGFLLNFLNVGVLAWWLTSMVVISKEVNHYTPMVLTYFGVTVIVYFLTDLIKIFFANKLQARLTPMVLLRIERLVGILLLIFGVVLIVRGYF
ncbi:MAG: LysE family transporter [Bacteroidota bacterium]|nr:LysE family transporter [Bacteroidota bacterium]